MQALNQQARIAYDRAAAALTGARTAGHILLEGRRRGAKWGVVTMCIGGGQGAAGLIEIF